VFTLSLAILAHGSSGRGVTTSGGCQLPAIGSSAHAAPLIEAGPARTGREVLRLRADVPLPGGTGRFDYQSIDTSARRLYLSHMGAGQLIVFDTDSDRVLATVGGVPGVTGVWAVPQLERVYASATGLHQLAIVDARTLRVVAHAGPIGFPDGIAYAPGVRKVFVSDESKGRELVVDAPHDRAAGVIAVGGEAGNTIYDAGSGCILVAVQTRNDIVAIDPTSNRVVGRYPFAGLDQPHGMSVDAVGRLLFIANEGDATLSVVDLRTMRVVSRHAVGADPDVLAWDPGWRRLYVAAEAGPLTVFEVRGESVVRIGSVAAPNAHTVSVSPTSHTVYLALRNVGGRAVLRIMDGVR
jgi:DNA-binding beta-propeller fold protein YncE